MKIEKKEDYIVLDLSADKDRLEESWLSMFGGIVKGFLKRMFGANSSMPDVKLKGSKSDVRAFQQALKNEKEYMDKYLKYGLDDPKTLKQKGQLKKQIKKFERQTNLKWPFEF